MDHQKRDRESWNCSVGYFTVPGHDDRSTALREYEDIRSDPRWGRLNGKAIISIDGFSGCSTAEDELWMRS